jgi:two-component system, sensor histidine kinase and response regulator
LAKKTETPARLSGAEVSDQLHNWHKITLDSIMDVVGIADITGGNIYMSPSVEKLLGYTAEERIGKHGADISHPDDLPIIQANFAKLTSKKEVTFEYRCLHKQGHYVWLEINFRLVKNEKCGNDYIVYVARDIEQRKALETELLMTATELSKTNKMKDKLFSLIAHDLKDPIHAIITLTEFTRKQLPKLSMDAFPEFVLQVNESAKTAYILLENLLQWAKLQTEIVSFHPQQTKLDRLIKDNMDLILLQAALKHIKVVINIPASLYIYADGKMLDLIIRNLLSNAVNYTKEHGSVTVSAEKTPEEVIIKVQDTGIGLSREQLKFMFSPDSRKKINSLPGTPGSGLGLILCKELMKVHNGTIAVESKLGKGTTFTLHFPLRKKKQSD